MSTALIPRPIPGILIGITHSKDLTPIIREPRVLKVGIGVPKGRASYVYTYQGRWIVRYGVWKDSKLIMETATGADSKKGFATRQECEQWYVKNKGTFAVSNRPQKIPFFTFTRRTVVEVNGKPEEIFEPDFAAIEAHGDTPRDIDVVFMGDNPLFGEFQAWSATELKCHGDGMNALRVLSLGNDTWPGWKDAGEAKERYFPVSQCFESGVCPYAQEGGKDKLVCKPMATLSFQLANSIRLGATAYFTTTSFRSIRQLFSSLEVIRSIASRAGSGIANTPMKLVLAPFRTNHNGMGATQYGVSLELRTQDVQTLRDLLNASSWKPTEPRLLAPAAEEEITGLDITAAEMVREFVPDAPEFEDDEPEGVGTPAAVTAQVATENKTDALAEKLKAKRGPVPPEATTAVAPEPMPAPVTGTRPVMPDSRDASWVMRIRDKWVEELGYPEFKAVLHSVTGSEDMGSICYENHKRIWDAMEKAKAKAAGPRAPGPTSGDIF